MKQIAGVMLVASLLTLWAVLPPEAGAFGRKCGICTTVPNFRTSDLSGCNFRAGCVGECEKTEGPLDICSGDGRQCDGVEPKDTQVLVFPGTCEMNSWGTGCLCRTEREGTPGIRPRDKCKRC